MKKLKFLFLFLCTLFIGFISYPIFGQTSENDAYEYPVKPGTKEWAELKSHHEMVSACIIPENVLKTISTDGLIQTCLNYPLFGDILFYDDLQRGFDAIVKEFNGFQELIRKEDAGIKIFEVYKTFEDAPFIETLTLNEKSNYVTKLILIETLLAQESLYSKLKSDERVALIKLCKEILIKKMNNSKVYGLFSQSTNCLLLGRIMVWEKYSSFLDLLSQEAGLKYFLDNAPVILPEHVNLILTYCNSYISEIE